MKPEAANYGIQREHRAWPATPPPMVGTMRVGNERAWSALAHLSTFLNAFTGFLGPVAAFVVWLLYRDRSAIVARHAMRSLVYQSIWLGGLFLGWTVTFFLTAIVVGVLLWPVMGILTLAFFAHASLEAYRVYGGVGARSYL